MRVKGAGEGEGEDEGAGAGEGGGEGREAFASRLSTFLNKLLCSSSSFLLCSALLLSSLLSPLLSSPLSNCTCDGITDQRQVLHVHTHAHVHGHIHVHAIGITDQRQVLHAFSILLARIALATGRSATLPLFECAGHLSQGEEG